MTSPSLKVEVAFNDGPFVASPTWTEIDSDLVLSFTTQEGRSSETDETTQPSQAAITFDNGGRTFDPEFTTGAYYGDLLPARQVRVTASIGGSDYVLFRGVINAEGWQQVAYAHPDSSRCQIVCIDLAGHLAQRTSSLGLFESYLQRVARGAGLASDRLNHWPLDDKGDVYEGYQTFSDLNGNYSLLDRVRAACLWNDPDYVYVNADAVYSDRVLRVGRAGSFNGFGKSVYVETGGAGAWTANVGNAFYQTHTFGFAVYLRSYPTVDGYSLARHFYAAGDPPGYFIDRDGTLTVSLNGTDFLTGPKLELGRTYLLTDTWDGVAADFKLYVNGELVAEDLAYPTDSTTQAGLYLGNYAYGGVETFMHANFADAFSMQYEMSAAEVALAYRAWLGGNGSKTEVLAGLLLESVGLDHSLGTDGRTSVLGVTDATYNVSSLLQEVERTEQGRLFYEASTESFTFISYAELLNVARFNNAQATLTDNPSDSGATVLRYSSPSIVALKPVNRVTVSNDALSSSIEVADSIEAYGVFARALAVRSEAYADPDALAFRIATDDPEPGQAVRSVRIRPTTDAEAQALLGLRLFEAVRLKRTPHNRGTQSSALYRLEGRAYVVGSGVMGWEANLFLSKITTPDPWLWGTGVTDGTSQGELYP